MSHSHLGVGAWAPSNAFALNDVSLARLVPGSTEVYVHSLGEHEETDVCAFDPQCSDFFTAEPWEHAESSGLMALHTH